VTLAWRCICAAAARKTRAWLHGSTSTPTTSNRSSGSRVAHQDRPGRKSTDGRTLNDAAFFLITAKEYARAIPFARRAAAYADKSTVTYGYATFNYGLALLKVGQCKQALPLLRHALKIEATSQAHLIRPVINQAKACSQPGASGGAP